MKWYKRHISDYREDTWHLSLDEHGAYCLLLDYYYFSEVPLPNDDRALASIIGINLEQWEVISKNVKALFTPHENKLKHKRCECELHLVSKGRNVSRKTSKEHREARKKVSSSADKRNGDVSVTGHSSVSDDPRLDKTRLDKKEKSLSGSDKSNPADPLNDTKRLRSKHVKKCLEIWEKILSPYCPKAKYPISDSRHEKLTARIRDQLGDIDGWEKYCERIKQSDFLMGRKDRAESHINWRPDFDWAIRRSTCDKIMEGNYDNFGDRGDQGPLSEYQKALRDWYQGGEKSEKPQRSDFEGQHDNAGGQ